ncbi:hypothetical protein A4G19_15505 [Pasteurellaceae bacterium Macca]|nr:hypothetical protein [Pasteurellaceae bacterium Macca]MCK3657066.1 hypothetical protein [Pasteurellaceae bacterium Macca]
MKPTNPKQALQEWKANHKAKTKPEQASPSKALNQKPRPTQKKQLTAVLHKPAESSVQAVEILPNFPQLRRQFWLVRDSVANCFEHNPAHFHLKKQLAAECQALAEALKQGKSEQNPALNHAIDFLIGQFKGVVREVNAVQQEGKDDCNQ